jgi:predicted dehydrogenase
VRGHDRRGDLLADDDVDLVVVSTPPNTHADQVLRALEAGKHVVVEKPFCLTVDEADRQIAAARDAGLLLAVYQNRRWDRDYLALKAAVRAGRLGEVFHLETFVGGYDHPCNFWHSDAAISGGAIYDWGSHYLDWVLDLLPQPSSGSRPPAHKRVWHDVTNADHTRVLLHFADGVEAEFTHSDLAAARKPKFYVLGTRGGSSATGGRVGARALADRHAARGPARRLRRAGALRVLLPTARGTSETALSLPPAPARSRSTASWPTRAVRAPMSVTPRARAATSRSCRRPRCPRRRRRPVRAPDVSDVRWGFVGAGMIATNALAPAVHAADGRGAAGGRRARPRPRRGARPGDRAPVVRRAARRRRGRRGLPQPVQRGAPAVDRGGPARRQGRAVRGSRSGCRPPRSTRWRRSPRRPVSCWWRPAGTAGTRGSASRSRGLAEIGRTVHVSAGFTFAGQLEGNYRLDPTRGGGAQYDVGCYAVSACLWAVGRGVPDDVRRALRARPHRCRPGHPAILTGPRREAEVRAGLTGGERGSGWSSPGERGRDRAARRAVHLLDATDATELWVSDGKAPSGCRSRRRTPTGSWSSRCRRSLRGGRGLVLPLEQSRQTAAVLDARARQRRRRGSRRPFLDWPAWRFLSLTEVAERMGIGPTGVRSLIKDGGLLAVRGRARGSSSPAECLDGDVPVKHLRGVLTLLRDAGYTDEEALAG